MPFIPHTTRDVNEMLASIGAESTEALFREIPANLRTKSLEHIPAGLSEMAVTRLAAELSAEDAGQQCFIGAGAYEHHIPAAVWELATRGEFYTAYTPYQAEASQGTLQTLYEYQSMMVGLTRMDVSNASNYDGSTALVEAIYMAIRSSKHPKTPRILLPEALHPGYRDVIDTFLKQHDAVCETLAFDLKTGILSEKTLQQCEQEPFTAIVIPFPNFFGCFEDVDALTDWAHRHQAIVIAVVNPTALALYKAPGDWGQAGADIVCGEGQPLGVPLASGGPYFGFLCCKKAFTRQLPGRIVGKTVDTQGKPGFTLTLQAREQHIRRAKATSNICTNQGLLVIVATIYMSLLGPEGLKRVAQHSHANTLKLAALLQDIPGVKTLFASSSYFHEAVVQLPMAPGIVLKRLATEFNIQGGYDLSTQYPQLGNALLVCATETKTLADLEAYARALKTVLARK